MFLTDDQVESRIGSSLNLAKREHPKPRRQLHDVKERESARSEVIEAGDAIVEIKPLNNGGRRKGDANMSPESRALVGAVAHLDTTANVAKAFNVSPHHVHELKHGMHSTAQGQNNDLVDAVNAKMNEPHELALQKLTETLLEITPEKIKEESSPTKLANIASSLARVAQSTAPIKKEDMEDKGIKLVVYAPTFKQENTYPTVPLNPSTEPLNNPA